MCESHTAAQYSSIGRTRVLLAMFLVSCAEQCKFLLRKLSVLLALCYILSMCVLNFMLAYSVMPRYLCVGQLMWLDCVGDC